MKIMTLPQLSQLLGPGFSQFFHHLFVLNFTELEEEGRETSACPFMLRTPIALPSMLRVLLFLLKIPFPRTRIT